jgi:diguanylate cyclase (GGDEF)-like protein/PAS domain S-box-containing protein
LTAQTPPNESARLDALHELNILDTPREAAFDDLTYLAATICGTPIALVSLVDEGRQWFKSCVGLSAMETSRDVAFCAHAILDPGALFVIEDATLDPRFRDNALVTGPPFVRFYAGAPLVTSDRLAMGTLCIIDSVPRTLTDGQRNALLALARQASAQLELRRVNIEQQKLTDYLVESEDRFRSAIESLQEGLVLQERSGAIQIANQRAETILGLTSNQLLGKSSYSPDWRAIQENGLPYEGKNHPAMVSLRTGKSLSGMVMGIHKPTGELTWISINTVPLFRGFDEEPYAVVATFADITERRTADKQKDKHLATLEESKSRLEEVNTVLERLSTVDDLTGLKNYRMFQQQLGRSVRRSQRLNQTISLLMIDVDRFKQYNDRFGHPAGDAVLRIIGATLQGTARASDLVARYGGEEFVVLLPNTDADRARIAAERFRTAIESVDWRLCPVTASIGVATNVGAWADAAALIEEADQALYRSKHQGRNRVTHADDQQPAKIPLHALVY